MIRSLFAVLLSLVAAAALAQDSFVIERIDVVTRRTIPKIIQAETRLVTGRAYTSEQLEQALYRVRRLPFVTDATYTLEPGSADNARVLRITLVDEKRFNYDFDIQGVATRGGYALTTLGFGLRFFPGETGVVDLTAGGVGFSSGGGSGSSQFGDFAAQYTMYGIGGTGIFAGIGASRNYSGGTVSPVLLLGVPITPTQTALASYRRSGNQEESNSILVAQWMYETTDDPYFARQGLDVVAGPQFQRLESDRVFNRGTPREFRVDSTLNSRGLFASAAKYWPRGTLSTWFVRGNALAARDTGEVNGNERIPSNRRSGDVLLGAARNFDGRRGEPGFFRVRLELALGYHLDTNKQGDFTQDRGGPQVFASVTYRSNVGVIRIGLGYVTSD